MVCNYLKKDSKIHVLSCSTIYLIPLLYPMDIVMAYCINGGSIGFNAILPSGKLT